MMVPGMYLSSAGDLNRTSWPGGSSGKAQTLVCLIELVTLGLPFGYQEFPDLLHVDGLRRSAWSLDGSVVEDLTWCWHIWPYGQGPDPAELLLVVYWLVEQC